MITVSNYPDKQRAGQYRLLVKFTGDDLASAQAMFGSERLSFEWDKAEDPPLKIYVDPESAYRLGKPHTPTKHAHYRTLTFLHRNADIPHFGTTITREEVFYEKEHCLELDLNLARLKPPRAVKRGAP